MVIDGGTVITGSFNFTKAAEEKNAENLLLIQDVGEIVAVPVLDVVISRLLVNSRTTEPGAPTA